MRSFPGLAARLAVLAIVASAAYMPAAARRASGSITTVANGAIAFTSSRDGNDEVYVRQINGTLVNVSTNPASDTQPSFSPSGSQIAFQSTRNQHAPEIFVMDADGANVHELTFPPAVAFSPAWSSDGTRIAFTDLGEIWTMNTDGSNQQQLTSSGGYDDKPAWSPDGTRIAFESGVTGNLDVYVMNADGTDVTDLTNNTATDANPSWSPDGTTIAFATTRNNPSWCAFPCVRDIYVMNTDGSSPINLTGASSVNLLPRWSPTGAQLVFERRELNDEIYVMNADGTGATNITNNDAFDGYPTWAPAPAGTLPTIRLTQQPNGQNGWFTTRPAVVAIDASDPNGVAGLSCTLAGFPITLPVVPLYQTTVSTQVTSTHPGVETLACSAHDNNWNSASASTDVKLDEVEPSLSGPVFAANPVRVGVPDSFQARAWDFVSGLATGESFVGADPGRANASPATFGDPTPAGGTIGRFLNGGVPAQSTPNLYAVGARVRDVAGNWSGTAIGTVVVYDPNGGSTNGSGWIIPGGASSDPGDTPANLDGQSKGGFGFSVQYKDGNATTPNGPISFDYNAGRLHFKAQTLQWLVIPTANVAYIEGTGTVQGSTSAYPFVMTVRDGHATGTADHLSLAVYRPGEDPLANPIALYKASGDVQGGQIKIQH